MGAFLAIVQIVGPALLQSAESGTLIEIAETAARLFALLRPLVSNPEARQSLDDLAATVAGATGFRPAQPEDPVFARQGAPRPSGR